MIFSNYKYYQQNNKIRSYEPSTLSRQSVTVKKGIFHAPSCQTLTLSQL